MNTEFSITEKREGEIAIYNITGELDALMAPQLKEKISHEIEEGTKDFIINFEEVVHINSLALGILRGKLKAAREIGGDIKLVKLNEHLKSIFEMIGLDELFEMYETEKDALENFKNKK